MHVKFGPKIWAGCPTSKFCQNPVAPLPIGYKFDVEPLSQNEIARKLSYNL